MDSDVGKKGKFAWKWQLIIDKKLEKVDNRKHMAEAVGALKIENFTLRSIFLRKHTGLRYVRNYSLHLRNIILRIPI